jgi:diguanylate cyclase (GGDEF)-like protein/PAS domain S-box-containing protein
MTFNHDCGFKNISEQPMTVYEPTFRAAILARDESAKSQLQCQLQYATKGCIRFHASVNAAVFCLEQHAASPAPGFLSMLVAPLDELGKEPGNVQHRIALLQESSQLLILGGLSSGSSIPSFIYPLEIEDTTNYPFIAEELGRRIDVHVKSRMAQTRAASFQTILESIGEALLVLDRSGHVSWSNVHAEKCLGYRMDELIGKDIFTFARYSEREKSPGSLKLILGRLTSGTSERLPRLQFLRKDSDLIIVDCVAKRSVSERDDTSTVLVFRDVTAQRIKEAELQLSSKVFEFSGEAIMITDKDDRILAVNSAFTTVTGYEAKEAIGRTPTFLSAGREDDKFYDQMWSIVHREGHWKGEVWNRRKDGEVYAEWLAVSTVRNDADEVDHYISIFSDITERKIRDERIKHQAQHDFLTELPNRILLEDRFNRIVANAQRHPQQVAMLFIDLDGFKQINDTLGHRVGDALLCIAAQRLRDNVRTSDTVSRHGGDEFVCLLAELTSTDAAINIAETILNQLRAPAVAEGQALEMTASIGISIYPDHGADLNELMSRADAAMYEAKRSGRNRYAMFKA